MPDNSCKSDIHRNINVLRPVEINYKTEPKSLETGPSSPIDLTESTDDEYLTSIETHDSCILKRRIDNVKPLVSEDIFTPEDQIKKKSIYSERPSWVVPQKNAAIVKRRKTKQGISMAVKKRIFFKNENYHPLHERLLDPDLDPPLTNTLEEKLGTADAEYQQDRLNYMLEREASYLCDPNYMEQQSHLTWQDREKSIGWMMTMCYQLKLLPAIIHLAVNLLDRYLSKRRIELVDLNKVALATLWLGAKYETTQYPSPRRLIRVSKLTFSKEDLVLWERRILIVLDFKVSFPNPIAYLSGISVVDNLHLSTKLMSRFLLEMLLFDPYFLQFTSSIRSAFSFYVSMKVLGRGSWDESFQQASGCTRRMLVENAATMLKKLNTILQAKATPYFIYNNISPQRVADLATVWINRFLKKELV